MNATGTRHLSSGRPTRPLRHRRRPPETRSTSDALTFSAPTRSILLPVGEAQSGRRVRGDQVPRAEQPSSKLCSVALGWLRYSANSESPACPTCSSAVSSGSTGVTRPREPPAPRTRGRTPIDSAGGQESVAITGRDRLGHAPPADRLHAVARVVASHTGRTAGSVPRASREQEPLGQPTSERNVHPGDRDSNRLLDHFGTSTICAPVHRWQIR